MLSACLPSTRATCPVAPNKRKKEKKGSGIEFAQDKGGRDRQFIRRLRTKRAHWLHWSGSQPVDQRYLSDRFGRYAHSQPSDGVNYSRKSRPLAQHEGEYLSWFGFCRREVFEADVVTRRWGYELGK